MTCALHILRRDGWSGHDFWCSPDQKMVYVAMLKCASVFFSQAFRQNGWTKIEFNDIRWTEQIVFGPMMEPRRRHVKGLVEDLDNAGVQSGWNAENFSEFFKRRYPCIGVHTLGYHQVYGEYTQKIKWLPLINDLRVQTHIDQFFTFHQIKFDWNIRAFTHVSTPEKKKLFETLWSGFQGEPQSWYEIEYIEDIALWEQISKETV